ncbi:unnamed protein product [Chrysodeixis includens]|uniref:Uncharacterized protein n=1 Tax=Chrysodeixis includens TaxID=689277 RepID=A0A9N8KUP2_CHRIL|nr:unnamed protein product [Chrysodeixis includens]
MSGDLASENHHGVDHSRNKKVHAAGALPIALPTLKNYMNNPQQGRFIYYGGPLHSVGMNGRRPAASELCWAPGAQAGRSFTPPPACGPAVYDAWLLRARRMACISTDVSGVGDACPEASRPREDRKWAG